MVNFVVSWTLAQSTASFQEEFSPIWQSIKELPIELALALPDSLYDFKPIPDMKSFAEQMIHIGHEHLILGKTEGLIDAPDGSNLSQPEIIKYFNSAFDKCADSIKNHDPHPLNRKVGQGELTVKWIFISIQDYVTHHRAIAILCFRLNGLVPAEYNYLVKGN